MSRPEDTLPPDLYYNDSTSRAYTKNSRIQHIQSQMTLRALEVLNLTQPSFVLDIGCGSGLSGEILSDPSGGDRNGRGGRRRDMNGDGSSYSNDDNDDEIGDEDEEEQDEDDDDDEEEVDEEMDQDDPLNPDPKITSTSLDSTASTLQTRQSKLSHTWIGLDISASMLSIARFTRQVTGDLMLSDMGQGIPFRAGTFDAAISISALQWLCTAEASDASAQPYARLRRFFETLHVALRRGARAVLQFYPKDKEQTRMIGKAARSAGFGAGVLIDDEGTKNEKMFLVLVVGGGDVEAVVSAAMDSPADSLQPGGGRGATSRGNGLDSSALAAARAKGNGR